jgi:hypothetical protein
MADDMTDNGLAALAAALRTILSDFDQEPDDEYMAVAVPMFLSLLPPDWCGHGAYEAEMERLWALDRATVATLRADAAATIDRWAEALSEIATLRAALDEIARELHRWHVEHRVGHRPYFEDCESPYCVLARAALATAKEAGK